MAGATISNYDEVLKEFYTEGVQEYLNNAKPLAQMIESNERDVSGRKAIIEMHMGRNTGIGARADGGTLPTAGTQNYKQAEVPMKFQYGRVKFTGPTIAATRNDQGAYVRVMNSEITGVVEDIMQDINRQYYGCGYGILGRWESGASSAHVVQNAYRGHGTYSAFGSAFGAKYMSAKNGSTDKIGVVVAASVSSAAFDKLTLTDNSENGFTVSSTSANANSVFYDVTFSANPSVSEDEGTWYARPGNLADVDSTSDAGAARLEMMGIRGLCNDLRPDEVAVEDGTNTGLTVADHLQNVNTSACPLFVSQVNTHPSGRYAGQRALTFDLMQEVFDDVEEEAGDSVGPDLIMTTRAIRRKYLALCRADRRAVNTMELDGGWKALDYNGVPLMVDKDAIDGEMYFLTLRDLQLYRMSDYDWMQRDGAILHRCADEDAYEATIYRYAELGVTKRNSQGVLCDISY